MVTPHVESGRRIIHHVSATPMLVVVDTMIADTPPMYTYLVKLQGGGMHGVNTMLMIEPEEQLVVAVLCNSRGTPVRPQVGMHIAV